jgi:hypothetical protein
LRVKGDARGGIVRRVPGAHAGEDGARPGPEAGEVVDVKDLKTPLERTEKDDEEDADQDRDDVHEIGSDPEAHVAKAMLGLS